MCVWETRCSIPLEETFEVIVTGAVLLSGGQFLCCSAGWLAPQVIAASSGLEQVVVACPTASQASSFSIASVFFFFLQTQETKLRLLLPSVLHCEPPNALVKWLASFQAHSSPVVLCRRRQQQQQQQQSATTVALTDSGRFTR